MKRTKILYWTFTGLFAAFMAFTAVPDVMMEPQAVKFITELGYPEYFIPFIGVAKLLGSIAILVPRFPTLKEWAFAGLFFDLIGAIYSQIAITGGVVPAMSFMLLPFAVGIASYVFSKKYDKMIKTQD
jgi:hypothetical protein